MGGQGAQRAAQAAGDLDREKGGRGKQDEGEEKEKALEKLVGRELDLERTLKRHRGLARGDEGQGQISP